MEDALVQLKQRIETRNLSIGVIGLGYVGLPVACLLANAGYKVIGVDLNSPRIEEINRGISPIRGIEPGLAELVAKVVGDHQLRATTNYADITSVQVVLIAVDTPIEEHSHRPLYNALRSALMSLGRVMGNGTLVIVESTIAPGTMDRIVGPTLSEASGFTLGHDFWIGHCPERVMPGRLLNNLQKMDRVVGGMTPMVTETMIALYSTYVQGTLDPTDPLTAELVKTGENTYRDINIAFANEMAMICEATGGDVWKVRTLLNKSPGRNMLLPGAGVGGHCIPKDPWLLAYGAESHFTAQLIPAARSINEGMPAYIFELTRSALTEAGRRFEDSKIVILGYAYLENSDDTRHSPTESLLKLLAPTKCEIITHDPFVAAYSSDLTAALDNADCVILMVGHDFYRTLDFQELSHLMRTCVLIDGRHLFDVERLIESDFIYRIVGIGRPWVG